MAQADVVKSLKAVTQAISQLKATPTADGRLLQLAIERIDSLVEVTSGPVSAPTSLRQSGRVSSLSCLSRSSLPALDCLSAVVTVLTDPVSPPNLLQACLQLLYALSSSQEMRAVLQTTLQITPILTNLLQQSNDDTHLHLICMKTVQAVTYNAVFTANDGYVEQLVRSIIPFILSPSSDRTVPALAILANVTRKSVSVQAYVKSLPNCRAVLRTLISCLSHSNVSIIVCSLAPLASICLHEELGEKLFNSKNVDQSFQLIFGLLTDDTGPMVIRYAVDLLCDLLTAPRIAQALVNYSNLRESLVRVVGRLGLGSAEITCKLLELLCALCTQAGLDSVRRGLVQLLLSPASSTAATVTTATAAGAAQQYPFLMLLQCAASDDDHQLAMQAWQLVEQVVKTCEEEEAVVSRLLPHFTYMIQAVCSPLAHLVNIQMWNTADADCLLSQKCLEATIVLQLLLRLVQEEQFSSQIVQHVTPDLCSHLLEQQLSNNPGMFAGHAATASAGAGAAVADTHSASATNTTTAATDHWSITGVQVALLTLQLMSHVNKHSTQIEVQLQRALQDVRLLPFLASSLKSEKKAHVQRALCMLLAACKQADHDDLSRLADVVANLNCTTRQRHGSSGSVHSHHATTASTPAMTSSSSGMTSTVPSFPFDRHCVAPGARASFDQPVMSPPSSQSQSGEVQALIERMQSGLDLKDIRAHEIMEIYEHELATRSTKETHLQDLLEAKTMALSQADRLIAQYRCRRAQSESECTKLRALLQECEKRSANQQLELQDLLATQNNLKEEIGQLSQSRVQLERLTEEHSHLRSTYDEQKHKLEGTMRSLAAAQEEQSSLSDLLDMQRKHCDKLKAQFESSNNQLESLERQHQQVLQQLSDKEMQCNELQHNLSRTEKLLAGREQDCGQLQKELHSLRADLHRAEEAKQQLARQVAALEEDSSHVKRRLESADKELDKHRKLREMIHSLSGGINALQQS
ncbi:protein CIP2A-like isoform X1 [Sycon ciliatum]|uniref:protein CIP2A-like isoform X1 n=1 Tax=Sycon ciliatum TaxID=27933 RepID=UPI0031F6E524